MGSLSNTRSLKDMILQNFNISNTHSGNSDFVYNHIANLQERNSPVINLTAPGNRLVEKSNGEIVLIPKTPAEVIGEKVLRPIVDTVTDIASDLFSIFSWDFPEIPVPLPLASAHIIPISNDQGLVETEETLLKEKGLYKDRTVEAKVVYPLTQNIYELRTRYFYFIRSAINLAEKVLSELNELTMFPPTVGAYKVAKAEPNSSKMQPLPDIALGKAVWEKHFANVEGPEDPLPSDIKKILNGYSPFVVEGFENFWRTDTPTITLKSHMLVWIPKKVNGLGISLNNLQRLFRSYDFYDKNVKKKIGGKSASSSHWSLISKNTLKKTEKKTYAEQEKLIQTFEGYTIPSVLDIVAAFLLREKEEYNLLNDVLIMGNKIGITVFGIVNLYQNGLNPLNWNEIPEGLEPPEEYQCSTYCTEKVGGKPVVVSLSWETYMSCNSRYELRIQYNTDNSKQGILPVRKL